MTWARVARNSDIAQGTTLSVSVTDEPVILCRTSEGELFAFLDSCTHDGGRLGNAEVVDNQVACPRHGARFDITTGQAVRMPAVTPLEPRTVRISDDGWIEVLEEED
jgi:3-phenylpropionate/trans-cinnamate dioxygenase ferredoxin subunit